MLNRLAMAASVFIRMGSALLVFVLLARGLGPVAYGLVATVFSYATLASLLTDFGFTSKALRDIAATPDRGGEILNAGLSLKIYLTVAVMVVGAIALAVIPTPPGTALAAGMLGTAVLIGAVGDLALTAYRAMGRYMSETLLTAWTSAAHLIVVGWVALVHADLLIIAAAYLVSRSLYTFLAVIGAERLFEGLRLRAEPLGSVWRSIKDGWGWAADSGLSYLNGQIDGLLVVAIFGLQAAGVYQAGARFVQAGLAVVVVLSSVHIPRLAFEAQKSGLAAKLIDRVMIEFAALGGLLGAGLWLVGPILTKYLLGHAYAATNQLWAGFGVFIFVRYISAGAGVQLSARNRPVFRVIGQSLGLGVLLIIIVSAFSKIHISYVPWIMAISASATAVFNMITLKMSAGKPRTLSA